MSAPSPNASTLETAPPGAVSDTQAVRSDDRMAPGSAMVIGLLMVSTFVVLLNEMMLGVALPTLIADLGITPTTGQWLTTGYLLTLAVLIPATGFVMRRLHTRTIFLGSMSLFLIGTVIAVVAPGFGVLFAGRIIQAVGTAVFVPLLITTTMRLVPASRRGRMMALVTAVPAIAPAVGPAVSGLVLSQLSWRWLFILMLPIIVATLTLGAVKLRNVTAPEPVTLDVLSLLLSVVGFGGLVFGLASIGESVSGHAPVAPYIPILIGLIGVSTFVYRQVRLQRYRDAFLDMRIFKTRSYVLPTIVMTFVAMNGFGVILVLPLILAAVLGLSTLQMGLFLFPGGAMIALVSALGGRVYDKVGPKPLAIPGSIIWAASIWSLTTIDENTSVWLVLVTYLVMTGTQALMWAPLTTSALGSLPTELYSHGTAAFSTVQQLAGAAGGAILISAFTIGANASHAGALDLAQSIDAGRAAFTVAAVLALGAVLGALFVSKAPTATDES
ncbi:DHA2 family efflux MFS transporter permease subunit [Arthrobacter sp. VKM Ac-2550]|uniref:DHA2 family efflux MFS transporter permease subunit n=1 Tax=Crystallibacter permensis TaxID=1938888 RepID=UPI0022275130|nr:DHA2 family efflux MFS transporter permease subunit [Arthrobacter sp. VKM Ac-2550]MCW2131923.1 MFS transporter, DHA2 family, lincomycin resistance protein [Arthrobacter sp. VKM Ac-2550]